MAIGFTAIAFACLVNSSFTSGWSPENYYRSDLLMGAGQPGKVPKDRSTPRATRTSIDDADGINESRPRRVRASRRSLPT